ncbi:MAG TPA: arginine--tRNA ligase [Rhodospirillaceae bacterium]|nr:arginine--tRNA ligase [Rhodospirillaceae bacterium]
MPSLITQLSDILGQIFESEGLDKSFGRVIVSDRPDLAQFQCNGAMAAAKAAKKNPRAVAEAVISKLKDNKIFAKIDIAGPGFINLIVTDDALKNYLASIVDDARCGAEPFVHGENVVLDYGGPNVAKAMHVGHLRSSIIGDSIRRILKFSGYNTIGDIHMGDWGTMMGMVISELELMHPEWVYFDKEYAGAYPAESPVTIEDLAVIYPKASGDSKSSPERMALSHAATVELQNKRRGYYALWQHMLRVSLESMKANFTALNVQFDIWKGESDVHDLIAPMVTDLKAKGYAVESDGAIVVHVKKNDDNKEFPPLILYKRDGGVMYGTTDLATLLDRMKEYNPVKILYIVDQRQNLHFNQVFRAGYITKIVPESVELNHLGHGTMNGTDGKPFKTRDGGVLRLEDLIQMSRDKALQRLEEAHVGDHFSAEEKNDVAMKVGIAAVKFADLQNNRIADYVFDLDRMTSFEGKTGPYLLYQAVRIKSLLEKAGYKAGGDIMISDIDRPLYLMLTELPEIIENAARNYTPHVICDHAYKLAQAFSSFYGNTHILSEENAAQKQSWLTLSAMVLAQLELMLDLIGVNVPQRM